MEEKVRAKRQTGRTSPSWNLEQAIAFAGQLKAKVGTNPASSDVVAQALGYSSFKNGSATLKIGALTHFGLLERQGRQQYKLTNVALRLLLPVNDAEKTAAMAEAALKPSLYSDLMKDYGGQALPQMFSNILYRTYGVAEKKAAVVFEVFKQTMEFAGLLQNGILTIPNHDSSSVSASKEERDTASKALDSTSGSFFEGVWPQKAKQSAAVAPEYDNYEVLLPGRRLAYLRLPKSLTTLDLEKLKKWIDFNREEITTEKTAVAEATAVQS